MFLKHILVAFAFPMAWVSFVRAQDIVVENNLKTYEVQGRHGSLSYEGKVERRETETKFEYSIVQLNLKFEPARSENKSVEQEITVEEIHIVAWKKPAEGKSRSTGLWGDKKRTSVILTEGSPTATLKEIKLALNKEAVGKADHVRLGLTDGKLVWPIKIKWDEQTVPPKPPKSGS